MIFNNMMYLIYLQSKNTHKFLKVLWPVRGKYRSQNDTGELFIKTNLRSLVVYLIFLALISISIIKK